MVSFITLHHVTDCTPTFVFLFIFLHMTHASVSGELNSDIVPLTTQLSSKVDETTSSTPMIYKSSFNGTVDASLTQETTPFGLNTTHREDSVDTHTAYSEALDASDILTQEKTDPAMFLTTTGAYPSGVKDKINFIYNSANMSAKDYLHSYCPRRCWKSEVVYISDVDRVCPDYFCFLCDCMAPRCQLYGICCPDVTEPYYDLPGLHNNYSALSSSPSPLDIWPRNEDYDPPALRCDNESSDEFSFLYIQSCPSDYEDDGETVRLCENDDLEVNFDLKEFVRAADVESHVVYRNFYCAKCNSVSQIVQFSLSLDCLDYMKVYMAKSPADMIRLASDSNSGCRVEQVIPQGLKLVPCGSLFFSSNVIDNCTWSNTSALFDEEITQACHEVNGSVHLALSPFTYTVYKNLFCSICHTDSYPGYGRGCNLSEGPVIDLKGRSPLPFTLLLRFVDRTPDDFTSPVCQNNEWSSPEGKCLLLNCEAGKVLIDRTCVSIVPEISGLSYQLHLGLLPTELSADVDVSESTNNQTVNQITAIVQKIDDVIAYDVELAVVMYTLSNVMTDSSGMTLYWLTLNITASPLVKRDIFEANIMDRIVLPNLNTSLGDGDITLYPVLIQSSYFDKDIVCLHENYVCQDLEVKSARPRNHSSSEAVTFSSLLTCAYVVFENKQYTIKSNGLYHPLNVTIVLDLNVFIVRFFGIQDLNMLKIRMDGSLCVCKELLDEKVKDYVKSNRPLKELLEIATLASLCASMACLLLMFMTYALFSELRTNAGVHNMVLAGSLMLAQAFILISSHMSPPGVLCYVVGIFTHFLWLFKFTSTSMCCVHMFHVFTAKTRHGGRLKCSLVARSLLFTVLLPAAIILAVILYHLITTEMQEIGYGKSFCYLDSATFVAIAVAGPALLISVVNLVFFILTVVAIKRVYSLQASASINRDHHTNLYVYAKLSTMTGTFWTLSIIAENLDVDFLRLIPIFINGLQGVFLFISYICNKRVLRLYLPRMSGHSDVITKVSVK
ncbi:adhesion G protein-coupled receptor E3 [Biomphalaria glabrata]|nr:adhesion G protein-coupled receptor E3-like [Biomphalaria glabrata]KAI8794858.1 adhesion G protein-coupled receptor E3 [Biomphalaria glabrata]